MSLEPKPNGADAPQALAAPAAPAEGAAAAVAPSAAPAAPAAPAVAAAAAAAPDVAAAPAPGLTKTRGLGLSWKPTLSWSAAVYVSLGGVFGGLVAAAALTLWGGSSRQVATLDLQSVIELQQLKLTAMVLKPGATDEDRSAAYTQVRAFGAALDQAIDRVGKSCGCVLLTRSAVIGASTVDLTDRVKRELGLDGASAEAWRKLAGAGFGQALPSPEALRSNLGSPLGTGQGGQK